MQPDPATSDAAAHVLVTAHGWPCVQRIVVLLGARGYVISSLQATPSAYPPYWQVGVDLRCAPAELALLQARLERIPSVTAVLTSAATTQGRYEPVGS